MALLRLISEEAEHGRGLSSSHGTISPADLSAHDGCFHDLIFRAAGNDSQLPKLPGQHADGTGPCKAGPYQVAVARRPGSPPGPAWFTAAGRALWRGHMAEAIVGTMNKNPDPAENDLIREPHSQDHLAEVYSEQVTPDIAEINEHAETLAKESEREPENL